MSQRHSVRSMVCLTLSLTLLACGAAQQPAQGAPPEAATSSAPPAASDAAAVGAPTGESSAATAGSAPGAGSASAAAEQAPQVRGCPEPADRSRVQLSGADVQDLVKANRTHLNAACWKPAIAKNPKGPDKVRVATELQVDGSGRVTEVKVVGGSEYGDFAPCLERELGLWCFPGAKQPSSLMFPMIFVKAEGEMMAVPR